MAKNIVLCIDGTGNEFGANNSNVVKLYSVLERNDQRQITFYHPGLGTMGARSALSRLERWWTKVLGLALGYGLSDALEDCYTYLIEKFEEGDAIFIFGFSRGAYLARALAAMVHMYGLVQRGNEPLIRYILKLFKKKTRTDADFKLADAFKATFSRPCKMHFIGVWDTVSSVGWIYDPVTLPFTAMNPDIEIGRHAISIDERRCAFRQNLWTLNQECPQNIRQVWFAGVHSDVGGGYPEPESGLAKISLEWMLEEAEVQGLLVNQEKKNRVLGNTDSSMTKPDFMAKMHSSLKGWWWILEVFPRRHFDTRLNPPAWRWEIPLASPRHIPAHSEPHPSVIQKLRADATYRPVNIPRDWT